MHSSGVNQETIPLRMTGRLTHATSHYPRHYYCLQTNNVTLSQVLLVESYSHIQPSHSIILTSAYMHSLSGVNQETIPLRMTGQVTLPTLPTVTQLILTLLMSTIIYHHNEFMHPCYIVSWPWIVLMLLLPNPWGLIFHPMNRCARYYYWLKLTTNNVTNNNQQTYYRYEITTNAFSVNHIFIALFFHVPLYWRLPICILYQEWIGRRHLWGWQVK